MPQDRTRQQHLRFIKDLQAAERHSVRKAMLLTARLRRLVFSILKSGAIPMEFASNIEEMYLPVFKEAMQTADLLGRKRAWITAESAGLKLGDIHSAAVAFFKRHDRDAVSEALTAHERNAMTVVRGVSIDTEGKLREALKEAVLKGETLRDSKRRIQETMDSLGLSPRNKGTIETLVRTQTQLAYSAGRWKAERLDPDIDEMIWGYKYVTAGDNRVREDHKNLDGVVLPKEHQFWTQFMPPNGFNCRCQAIPLYDQQPVKFPPRDANPDKTFNFNPGQTVYGSPSPRTPEARIDVPAESPSIDRLAAAVKSWTDGSTRDDIRKLLSGQPLFGVSRERAMAILQALGRADLNRQRLYRETQDRRSGILEFTSKKLDNPAETLEPNTVRALKIAPYRWIVDVRK